MFLGKIEAGMPLRPTLPRRPAMHWRLHRSPHRTGVCQNRKTDRRPANARGGRRGSNSVIVWSRYSTCTRPQCAVWFHGCRPIDAYQFSVPTCQGKSKRLSGKLRYGTSKREQCSQVTRSAGDRNSLFTSKYRLPLTVTCSNICRHFSYQQPKAAVPVSAINRGVRSSLFSIIARISSRSFSNVLTLTWR